MTYRLTLDKLRKLKGQKTFVPEELRKRDQANAIVSPIGEQEDATATVPQPTASTATRPGSTP